LVNPAINVSMSNMRIRNIFLLVTALAVMFLLGCGGSDSIENIESIGGNKPKIKSRLIDTLVYDF